MIDTPPQSEPPLRQVSTTPPPAPGPYIPTGQAGGTTTTNTFASTALTYPSHNTTPNTTFSNNSAPSSSFASNRGSESSPPPPPPPPPAPPVAQTQRTTQQDYESLQRSLKAKFDKVQAEYELREAGLIQSVAEVTAERDALRGKQKAWGKKDADMKSLHEVIAVQQALMEEQLESLRRREENAAKLEAKLDETHSRREEDLTKGENTLAAREKALQHREITAARLEKQHQGLQRQNAKKTAACNTTASYSCKLRDASGVAKDGTQMVANFSCNTTDDPQFMASFRSEIGCQADCIELDSGGSLREFVEKGEAFQQLKQRAESLWTSGKRREAMLDAREAEISAREQNSGALFTKYETLSELSSNLYKAVASAETKLADLHTQNLSARLHHREKTTLLAPADPYSTPIISPLFATDKTAELTMYEGELLALRGSLHEMCVLVKTALRNTEDEDTYPPRTPLLTTEEELRAENRVLVEKERRFDAFLMREIERRSLEAQKFDVSERTRALQRREAELEEKQAGMNETLVKIGQREVQATRLEEEATGIIKRLDITHQHRAAVEQQETRIDSDKIGLEYRAKQIDKQYETMKKRFDLLRERERRFEERIAQGEPQLLDWIHAEEGRGVVLGASSTMMQHPATPSPSPFLKRRALNLEEEEESALHTCTSSVMESRKSRKVRVQSGGGDEPSTQVREKKKPRPPTSLEDTMQSFSSLISSYAKDV